MITEIKLPASAFFSILVDLAGAWTDGEPFAPWHTRNLIAGLMLGTGQ